MTKEVVKKGKGNWLSRALEGRKARFGSSVAGSVGLNLAGGAGAGGVILGSGETLTQKVFDAITAIPEGIANTIRHYIHAPEYARQADAALTYLKERGPEAASELNRAKVLLENSARQAHRATDYLNEGKDYLFPGGEKSFDLQEAFYSMRDGMNQLESAVQSANAGREQAMETAGPAIDILKEADLNPILQALHNLADNIAPDEIAQTVGIAAASVLTGYLASQYVRSYWGRRGRPGIVARYIQRKGLKKFRDYFTRHPEAIAGKEAVAIYEENLAQNPERLEQLAKEAGYELRKANIN